MTAEIDPSASDHPANVPRDAAAAEAGPGDLEAQRGPMGEAEQSGPFPPPAPSPGVTPPTPAGPPAASPPPPAPPAAVPQQEGSIGASTAGAAVDAGTEPAGPAAGVADEEPVEEPGEWRHPASQYPLPRVLAVANQKGGVGKTTTTINLAACLAELGHRVLVVDLDPQANATTGLGIDPRSIGVSMYDVILREVPLDECALATGYDNLRVAPSSLDLAGAEIELVPAFNRERKLALALDPLLHTVDYVLIDCPPSLGLLTVNALTAAGEVLVPIQCEYYALEGLGQLLRNVELVQRNLNPDLSVSTIALVMYDARTKLASQVVDEVRAHFGDKVCRQVVPRSVRLSEAPSFGQPIIAFDSRSRGALAYRELAKEVSGGSTDRTR